MDLNKTYEEDELIALLQQRSLKAFSNLYDKYAPALYTVILQIVRDKETANELLKDIFHKIMDTINSFDPVKERFFIWMFKIARGTSVEWIKSHNPEALNQTPATGKTPHEAAGLEMDNYGLKKLMAKLKEEHRVIVELCYYRGFTHAEIAKALNIPIDTIQPKLRLAFLELRNLL